MNVKLSNIHIIGQSFYTTHVFHKLLFQALLTAVSGLE